MDSNIIELVKLGHERADELKAACGAVDVRSVAQLISDLASQLEVQYVRAEESRREFRSADITMQNLEAKCAVLAAENAGLKKFCKDAAFDADYESELGMERGGFTDALNDIKTPATDAFLAEVRASELDSLAGVAETMLVKFSNQRCSSDMHEVVGWKMVLQQASNRAAQLRKGAWL
ncbi:hypothetical protein [Escherichia marmotae]|uniref:hypothetical protein n=1 Tax=Escherichia marmotae TaxID=1499973 RepID=UPI002FE10DE5